MDVSRRDMLKGSAVLAAGLAATGAITALGCSSETKPAGGSVWPPAWSQEADFVVLGFGAAGAIAALTAADEGMSVIVAEAADYDNAGGSTSVSGGIFTVTGRPWLGWSATPEMLNKSSMGGGCEGFAESYISGGLEIKDYLESINFPMNDTGRMVMAKSAVEGYSMTGYVVFDELRKAVEAREDLVTVLYESPAFDIVQDPITREVYGAVVGTREAPVYLKANKGVLIATGGYEANQKMMSTLHHHNTLMPNASGPYCTGEGARIGMKAGGDFRNVAWCYEIDNWCIKPASEEVGCAVHASFSSSASLYGEAGASFVFVNRKGERFMNERMNIGHTKTTLAANDFYGGTATPLTEDGLSTLDSYVNWPCFAIFDSSVMNSGAIVNAHEAGWLDGNPYRSALYEWSSDNKAELAKGWIIEAATIEELAAKLGATDEFGNKVAVDPAVLRASIDAFNAGCASGIDAFGRSAEDMAPIEQGPFYAVELCIGVLYTIGGLFHDKNACLLDHNNEVIPRLYAAGNVGTNSILRSEGLVGAMLYGRAAAKHAATLEPATI